MWLVRFGVRAIHEANEANKRRVNSLSALWLYLVRPPPCHEPRGAAARPRNSKIGFKNWGCVRAPFRRDNLVT